MFAFDAAISSTVRTDAPVEAAPNRWRARSRRDCCTRCTGDHLAIAALGRVARFADRAPALVEACRSAIESAVEYAREHFEDPPDIQNWIWTD